MCPASAALPEPLTPPMVLPLSLVPTCACSGGEQRSSEPPRQMTALPPAQGAAAAWVTRTRSCKTPKRNPHHRLVPPHAFNLRFLLALPLCTLPSGPVWGPDAARACRYDAWGEFDPETANVRFLDGYQLFDMGCAVHPEGFLR